MDKTSTIKNFACPYNASQSTQFKMSTLQCWKLPHKHTYDSDVLTNVTREELDDPHKNQYILLQCFDRSKQNKIFPSQVCVQIFVANEGDSLVYKTILYFPQGKFRTES